MHYKQFCMIRRQLLFSFLITGILSCRTGEHPRNSQQTVISVSVSLCTLHSKTRYLMFETIHVYINYTCLVTFSLQLYIAAFFYFGKQKIYKSVFCPSGGHFVCKVFDLFTPFSVGLVYLMYRVFDELYVFKPVTSRPANSER